MILSYEKLRESNNLKKRETKKICLVVREAETHRLDLRDTWLRSYYMLMHTMVVQFRGVFDARVILMSVELSVCACPGGFGAVVHNSTRQPAGYERTQGPPSTYSLVLIWGVDDVDNGWVFFCQTVENIPYSSWNFGSSFSF